MAIKKIIQVYDRNNNIIKETSDPTSARLTLLCRGKFAMVKIYKRNGDIKYKRFH